MVAHDLVLLDEICAALVEPRREPLVQLGARRLRQRVVRGVADEEVPEAVRIITGQRRALGPNQILAHKDRQPRIRVTLLRCKRDDRAAMEFLPLDRAALEHNALLARELVEARREQRLDCRRHDDVAAPGLAHHRDHFLDEERVPVGGCADSCAQAVLDRVAREQLCDQLACLDRGERLEQRRGRVQLAAGPAGPLFEQLGARHAEKQDRRVARKVADVLDEIEERGLAPVHVVEDDDERLRLRDRFEELAKRPGRLLRGARLRLGAQQAAQRCQGGGVRCQLAEPRICIRTEQLLQHLDDGEVGDALAVGEAAAAYDERAVELGQQLIDETRFADPGSAEQCVENACALVLCACKCAAERLELVRPPDERRVPASRLCLAHRQEAERRYGLGLALQRERRHRLCLDGVAHETKRFFA